MTGKAAINRVFSSKLGFFSGGYLSEPICVSLLSGYNEMSTEPRNAHFEKS